MNLIRTRRRCGKAGAWGLGLLMLALWGLGVRPAQADCVTNPPAIVDLSTWSRIQYDFLNGQPDALWVLSNANTVAIQTVNADASIFLSPFVLASDEMRGSWRVDNIIDDDFIGFVFGYQDSTHYYLFDWKQADQLNFGVWAERGMSVKVVEAGTPLTGADLFATTNASGKVRLLYHNTVIYNDLTDYGFHLQFQPGQFSITVTQGLTVLASFTLNDATYTSGQFGFYNFSQDQVRYSGFTRTVLAPRPLIQVSPPSVVEGHAGTTNLVFSVTLSTTNCNVTAVDYAVVAGTATANVDYQPVPGGTLFFPPGITNLLVTVPVVGDRDIEPNETLFLRLSNVVNGTLGATQIAGTIVNDDFNELPVVTLLAPAPDPCLTLPTNLLLVADAQDSDGTIARVQFWRNGTILLGEVFAPPYELPWANIPAGTSSLTAVAWDDRGGRGTSAPVVLVASMPSALSINDRTVLEGSGGVTAQFTVTLTPSSCRTVTVEVATFDGSALAGLDYSPVLTNLVFAPGQTTRSVLVPILGDAVPEPDETFTVCLASETGATLARACGVGTIVNDDTNRPPVVVLSPVDPCLLLPADLVLSAQAGDSDPQDSVVRVQFFEAGTNLLGEVLAAPFTMTWSNVPSGIHSLTAVAWDGFGASTTSAPVNLTASSLSALVIDDQAVAESDTGTNLVFTVRLDPPSCRPVSVGIVVFEGTAQAVADYTPVAVTLQFPPGVVERTVSVPVVGDTESEPDETLTICLTNVTGAVLARSCGLGRILNDDTNQPPVVVITYPSDGAVFSTPPGFIPVQASAIDVDGVVTQVQFYANGVWLGAVTNGPFLLPWTNHVTGPYTLLAIATDDVGARATSAPVNITVRACNPTLTVAPLANQTRCVCDEVTFSTTVQSAEAVSIAWKFGGAILPGETNTTLRLFNLHPAAAGVYTVEVTSPCATISRSASLALGGAGNANPVSFTNAARVTIFDNATGSPYPSALPVDCVPGPIKHIAITLRGLTHNYPDDVDILLAGPAGAAVRLISDAGGSQKLTNVVLTFTDTATNRLPDAARIVAGTYAPTDYESPLDTFPLPAPAGVTTTNFIPFLGTIANGSWNLFVRDDLGGDGGSISNGWTLTIEWEDTLPGLASPEYLSDGTFRAVLTGLPRMTHVVEASFDLVTWEPVSTNTLNGPLMLAFPPTGGVVPQRFFRAVRCP